ncbi:hypothetical protein HAX54_045435 [Datura stramonium]|uniref:Uncharacterized protein n=1 Tax=Datura stramonium TaxID=4076 RepID=A0ABS8WHW4_DATST|nr:hypothetical protein [Datura stramonium]
MGVKMSPFERLIQSPKVSFYAKFLQLINEMWRREERKDVVLIPVMIQIEFLANCMIGFHSRYQQANQGYWYPRDEDQVSIKHLEERMNLLASQMESKASMITHEPMKEDTTLTPSNVDDEDIEWEVEDSFFKDIRRHSLEY